MKLGTIKKLGVALILVIGGLSMQSIARGQSAKINIDNLNKFSDKASQTVDVTLDRKLLQLGAHFLSAQRSSDEAKVKEIVSKLQGVYVKSFEFDNDGEFSKADVDAVLAQLKTPDWSRIVGVLTKKKGDNVEVFINTNGDEIGGLAVVAWGAREFTVVNIVGPIDVQKLAEIEGNFGIPRLHLYHNDSKDESK